LGAPRKKTSPETLPEEGTVGLSGEDKPITFRGSKICWWRRKFGGGQTRLRAKVEGLFKRTILGKKRGEASERLPETRLKRVRGDPSEAGLGGELNEGVDVIRHSDLRTFHPGDAWKKIDEQGVVAED